MSAPTLDKPTEALPDNALPTGWRGPIMPVNTRSGDRRIYVLDDGADPLVRPLPQPLNAQKYLDDAHKGSIVVGLITRVWVDGDHLWAEGPFDLDDPEARDWAAKLGRGMAGWVSADMSDISVEQVPLDSNDDVITDDVFAEFETAHNEWVEAGAEGDPPPGPDVREVLYRVPSWKLMGVTLVSGPAFESARIEPVYGEEFTPVHAKDALVAAAAVHTGAMIALVPSEEDCARLAIDGYEAPEILHTTLVFLGEAAAWDDTQRSMLETLIRELGLPTSVRGSVFGHARLNTDSDEPCAVYLVEADGLSSLRAAAFGAVADGNLDGGLPPIPDPYDNFLPHVTAGYNLDVAELTETGPIRYDRIRISFADTDVRDIPLEPIGESLVASGIVYDAADFEQPEPDEYTLVTVTDDGRISGHIAPWDGCHAAFPDACVAPPFWGWDDDYNSFHQGGPIATTNGLMRVGKITFGTGHAGHRLGVQGTLAHYDNTGTVGALVRCRNGQHGPFVSGRLLPGLSDDQIHTIQHSAVSGDWRKLRPNARTSARLELIAVLSVNSPGFMAPRNRAYVGEGRQTLIASSAFVDTTPAPTPEVKVAPRTKQIALDQAIASATRATRCAAAAQRVRAARLSILSQRVAPAATLGRAERLARAAERARLGRLSLVRNRIDNLDALTAANRQRRVETPEGARHYGQPVGSIIVTDGPRPRGNDSASDTEEPERVRVTPAEVLDAGARISTHLHGRDDAGEPTEYDLPAVVSEMNEHNGGPSDVDLDAILDGNRRPAPDPTPGVTRTYDGDTLQTVDPEDALAVATGIHYAARYTNTGDDDRPVSASGVDLGDVDQEKVANTVLATGLNVPHLMDADVTPEEYQQITSQLRAIVANDGDVPPVPRQDRWMEADYDGGSIDTVSKQTADDIAFGVQSWLQYENSQYGDSNLSEGRTLDQFDMAAVADDVVAADLNVPYFHTGLSGVDGTPDGDWEIDDDTEWPVMGEALWDIMQRHPRTGEVPNTVTVPPRVLGELSNAERIQEYADITALVGEMTGETDWESDTYLAGLTVPYGLNVRAGMSDSQVDDAVRNEVRRLMQTGLDTGRLGDPTYDEDGDELVASAARTTTPPRSRELCAVRTAAENRQQRVTALAVRQTKSSIEKRNWHGM